MEIKTYGLCLSSTVYGEKDKLCNIATLEEGKILAKLVSYAKSKLRLCGETFCFGEYILSKKNNRYTVINCSIAESFVNCWQNIEKNLCANVIVELLEKLSYGNSNIKDEIISAVDALKFINYKETFPVLFVIRYMLKLFNSLGIDVNDSYLSDSVLSKIDMLLSVEEDYLETLEIYKHEATVILKGLYSVLNNFSEIKVFSLEKLLNSNYL